MSHPNSSICGVLLAAGRSTRFSCDKRLHRLPGGEAMIVQTARKMIGAVPNSVAVIRDDDAEVADLLESIGMRIVVNPVADQGGMGSSISCGVRTFANADGWIILPGDMPFVLEDTVRLLASAVTRQSIAAPVYRGTRGHPVGFGAAYKAELTELDGVSGARHLLVKHAQHLNLVETGDPGTVRDIDTPHDLADLAVCAKD